MLVKFPHFEINCRPLWHNNGYKTYWSTSTQILNRIEMKERGTWRKIWWFWAPYIPFCLRWASNFSEALNRTWTKKAILKGVRAYSLPKGRVTSRFKRRWKWDALNFRWLLHPCIRSTPVPHVVAFQFASLSFKSVTARKRAQEALPSRTRQGDKRPMPSALTETASLWEYLWPPLAAWWVLISA